MTNAKRDEIKNNLNKIKTYLIGINRDGEKQVLIDRLQQPESCILLLNATNDSAFQQTKAILRTIVPESLSVERRTAEQQEKLVKKLIQDCMTQVLSTAAPGSATRFTTLPESLLQQIARYDSNAAMPQVSKNMYHLFRSIMTVQELLNAVVWSDAEDKSIYRVEDLLRDHPDLLFKTGQITRTGITKIGINGEDNSTLYEQTYYDVSPFQLILFAGDMYLLEKIKPLITAENSRIAKAQCDVLAGGGSDLVRLGDVKTGLYIKNINELSYEELTQFVEKDEQGEPHREPDEHGTLRSVTYPLLQNKNGVVAYRNCYYYVCLNHQTKMVEEIKPILLDETLIDCFRRMEENSGQRSSNRQHELIQNTAGVRLERRGIIYQREGDYYQDGKAEGLIVLALRKYIRLRNLARAIQDDPLTTRETRDQALDQVQEGVFDLGKAQATDTADKLLLYCIKDLRLLPIPDFSAILHPQPAHQTRKRKFEYNGRMVGNNSTDVPIYKPSHYVLGDFALFKAQGSEDPGGQLTAFGTGGLARRQRRRVHPSDLIASSSAQQYLSALRRYGEVSRALVDEFTQSLNLPAEDSNLKGFTPAASP